MSVAVKKLELDKILAKLGGYCTCSVGRELAAGLSPATDIGRVQSWLKETSEAREVLRLHQGVPLGGIRDIRQAVSRAKIGGVLEPAELLAVLDTVMAARQVRHFCQGLGDRFPLTWDLARGISLFNLLETEISRTITGEGTVADSASPELARLRKQIRSFQDKVREKLESILRAPEYHKMLQEPLVTVRADRYVVPVKQEYRSQFKGLVHDQSASGATLFIEPIAVLELNNELRRLQSAEEREVEAILSRLSGLVGVVAQELSDTLEILGKIDLVFAKGRLSMETGSIEPMLNARGQIKLCQARHPLLTGGVVPISMELGRSYDTLVITGPNTGGKTVTLKTVGLQTLMAQCGLHIPAGEGTELSVFTKIFADIGDEQSIEQSLSTFSSHIKNIVATLAEVDAMSLVLLDEIGAGTDPTEGAALATAMLEFIRKRKSKTIATTHYSQLKTYAFDTPGVENASVEFDVETLRPTFRLLVGLPGRSNALEIASRLGMPAEIIEEARGLLATDEVDMANLIQHLTETRYLADAEREEASRLKESLAQTKTSLDQHQLALAVKERQILTKARTEIQEMLNGARKEADRLTHELKTTLTREAMQAQQQAARAAKEELDRLEDRIEQALPTRTVHVERESISSVSIGQWVEIPRLNLHGTVISGPSGQGEVVVQAGVMKVIVSLNELQAAVAPCSPERQTVSRTAGTTTVSKSLQISPEIHLRGLKVEAALQQVDKYLDDAFLAGLHQVTIIHGKGTGVLRSAIKEFLSAHPQVLSFRLGTLGEGGTGVTVVELAGR